MKELNQEQIDSLIEKVERTYEDMDKAIQSVNVFLNEIRSKEEIFFESIIRQYAEPPIKGEITKGKLKWRGIKACIQKDGIKWNKWLEQRGVLMGSKFNTY